MTLAVVDVFNWIVAVAACVAALGVIQLGVVRLVHGIARVARAIDVIFDLPGSYVDMNLAAERMRKHVTRLEARITALELRLDGDGVRGLDEALGHDRLPSGAEDAGAPR